MWNEWSINSTQILSTGIVAVSIIVLDGLELGNAIGFCATGRLAPRGYFKFPLENAR